LSDAAQSFGATYKRRKIGSIGLATATSFFPAKPLGCYGDGGAVFTNDDELAELLHSIRMHGQGRDRYENVRIGVNSRLDTIQAAILIEKLKIFPQEIEMREKVARRYNDAFRESNKILVPHMIEGAQSTWAQYTIQVSGRDGFQSELRSKGVPTAVYYPTPLSRQKGYTSYLSMPTPISEKICNRVISLPMYPDLDAETQDHIIEAVLEIVC
jgi:dTDP-4-amino-4,6-dideoxygalactose transaminase